jgi:hypothetical protein
MRVLLSAALLAQFAVLLYDPLARVPDAASRNAGARLVETVAAIDGEVDLPLHPSVALLAGKRLYAHAGAFSWVMLTDDEPLKAGLITDIDRAFRERRYDAVICEKWWYWIWPGFRNHYRSRGPVFSDPDVFLTITGMMRRPIGVFVPRPKNPGFRGPGSSPRTRRSLQ